MSYVLENENEVERLEKQSQSIHYSIKRELSSIHISHNSVVLDAGCGTCILSRYLLDLFPSIKVEACDFSRSRLREAKRISKGYPITYFQADLAAIPVQNSTYDQVFSRYVFQHLANYVDVANELYRVTKKGGSITVIETDGIFFELKSANKTLNNFLLLLKDKLPFDLYIGRKLKNILANVGYHDLKVATEPMHFQGPGLDMERVNYQERFAQARPTLQRFLGKECDHFIALYLQEMMKPASRLEYTKYIVRGRK